MVTSAIKNDKMHTGTVSNGAVTDITMNGWTGGIQGSITIYNASSDELWYYDDDETAYITILPSQTLGGIRWKKIVKLSGNVAGVAYRIYEEHSG